MPLLNAAYLGIERFAGDQNKENWASGSDQDKATLIRAVYRQVLGNQYVMESERLKGAESLFRTGYLSTREFVRTVAKSGLYRAKFFENCNPYHFIELNFKHLLGRAPQGKAEMLHHFTILQEHGFDAEIDSYLDSAEYQERFGEEVVPYMHGWDYSVGQQGLQFSWLMQLSRGVGASVKGETSHTNFRLGKALHQERALPVVSPNAMGALPRWPRASAKRPRCIGWKSLVLPTIACTSAATLFALFPLIGYWKPSRRSIARGVAWPVLAP